MDYGQLLNRAWNIVWEHKFLIVLGILVALGSGMGSSSSTGANYQLDLSSDVPSVEIPQVEGFGQSFDLSGLGLPLFVSAALVGVAMIIALVVWVISTVSRGGLIAGADAADSAAETGFGLAWSAAWNRAWTLLGIAILPALPGLVILGLGILGFVSYRFSVMAMTGALPVRNFALIAALVACLVVPLILVLEILRTFANRACMMEGLGVLASYRRGINLLTTNLGSALVLFLIQIAVSVGLFLLFLVPTIIMALCCIFWPVLILLQGAVTAYFSTMWTLAWREWTTGTPVVMDELLAA